MLDPLTSLAFAIHNAKGVYALLLGSGISRAAQVPTGWEVTLDLIGRIAAMQGDVEKCRENPEAWYQTKFGVPADYSNLLESLAITPAERTAALARYFEETGTDEDPNHQPTAAHTAIAKLVKQGYIRVIVTTNFDRLMERALENEGISPSVLSTPDDIKGALPLAHATCTLIKVHGDYRDLRLRNTLAELSTYDEQTQSLLDRVFDEYGLVVSGWSATWDIALRNVIARAPNRRFTTVWSYVDTLTTEAEDLIRLRSAQKTQTESADSFFVQLQEKVSALAELDTQHPLSIELAVRSVKKFVAEDRFRVQLHDLVMQEVTSAMADVRDFSVNDAISSDLYIQRVQEYESGFSRLLPVLLNVARWCKAGELTLLQSVVGRLMTLTGSSGGYVLYSRLQSYPACLAFYAIGLGLLASEEYGLFAQFARYQTDIGDWQRKTSLAVNRIAPSFCLNGEELDKRLGQKFHTPQSDRIFSLFAHLLRATFQQVDYQRTSSIDLNT